MRPSLPGDGCKLSETHNETGQKEQVCASPLPAQEQAWYVSTCQPQNTWEWQSRCDRWMSDAASPEQRIVKAGPPLTRRGAVSTQNLLQPAPNWLCRRSTAASDCQTCCAPICDVASVGRRVERQCDNTVTGCLTAIRSLLDSTHCSASLQLFWTLPKALTMRGKLLMGLLHDGRFPTGRQPSARQGMLRVCARCLSTYRYR